MQIYLDQIVLDIGHMAESRLIEGAIRHYNRRPKTKNQFFEVEIQPSKKNINPKLLENQKPRIP